MSDGIQSPYNSRFQNAMLQKYLCLASLDLNNKLKREPEGSAVKKNLYRIMYDLSDMECSKDWENTLTFGEVEVQEIKRIDTFDGIGLYELEFKHQVVQLLGKKKLLFAGPFSLQEFTLPVIFFFGYDISSGELSLIRDQLRTFEPEDCSPYAKLSSTDSLWTRWLRRGLPVPTHRPEFDPDVIERILEEKERANIRLNTIGQIEALKAMPPLLINGQAGSGKTTVLVHKMAWSVIQHREHRAGLNPKVLYISFSDALKEQAAKDVRSILETIHQKRPEIYSENMQFHSMNDLLREDAGGFPENRRLGFGQFKSWYGVKRERDHQSRSIPAERAWHAIRLLKGRGESPDRFQGGKKGKDDLLKHVNDIRDLVTWSKNEKEYLISIVFDYQDKLSEEGKWDDLDLARRALKNLEWDVSKAGVFDEIFCDEAQDFTEIELGYLAKKCSRNPLWPTKAGYCLNLAGDDMQTINPTGFNWNSYLKAWSKTSDNPDVEPQMFSLQQNERSDKRIVKVGNRFLEVKGEIYKIPVEMQEGADFGEEKPLYVIDDDGFKIERAIADWVIDSIKNRDQNFGIIIHPEYEIDVIHLLENDSLFRTIFDSDTAKNDLHIDTTKGEMKNLAEAMKLLSALKNEERDEKKINLRIKILFTILQKLRVYRVSDIKGLERRKILLHKMAHGDYMSQPDERRKKRFTKQMRHMEKNVDVDPFSKYEDTLKADEKLDLSYRLNRHYIAVSRAMTNLLIFEEGRVANKYWGPLVKVSDFDTIEYQRPEFDTEYVKIINDDGILRSQLQSTDNSWVPEERKTQDFNELYKFAVALRDAAGRDGVPQRLRAIAVLREATENNDDLAKLQHERAEDLLLELEAKVAELQKDFIVAAENYHTLGNRYVNRSGNHAANTQMGIESLEKSGDCYRIGAQWEKAAQVYGRILSLRNKTVPHKLRVRVRGWEQECKFQTIMDDGTSMGKREGDAVTLPGHLEFQNFPECIADGIHGMREYCDFIHEIQGSPDWTLMLNGNGPSHIINLAYAAKYMCDLVRGQVIQPYEGLEQDVEDISLVAALAIPANGNSNESWRDELLGNVFNLRVSNVIPGEYDSMMEAIPYIENFALMQTNATNGWVVNNSELFSRERKQDAWQQYLHRSMQIVIEHANEGDHNFDKLYKPLISISRAFFGADGSECEEFWLDSEGVLLTYTGSSEWRRIQVIHKTLVARSKKWENWSPGVIAGLVNRIENEDGEISVLNSLISDEKNSAMIHSQKHIMQVINQNLMKRFGRTERDRFDYGEGRIRDPYRERNDPIINDKGVRELKKNGFELMLLLAPYYTSLDMRRGVFWYLQIENQATYEERYAEAASALYERAQIHIKDQYQKVRWQWIIRALARSAFYYNWAGTGNRGTKEQMKMYREKARSIVQEARALTSKNTDYGDVDSRGKQKHRFGVLGDAVRLYRAVGYHLEKGKADSEIVKRYNQLTNEKNFMAPKDYAKELEKTIQESGQDPDSVITNYLEKRNYPEAAEFINRNMHNEKFTQWAINLAISSHDWLISDSEKSDRVILRQTFNQWFGAREKKNQLREMVVKQHSSEEWAKIIHAFFEDSDLIGFLIDMIGEGEKWAETMFLDVAPEVQSRLVNHENELTKIIEKTDDFTQKKMMQMMKRTVGNNIRDIEIKMKSLS